MAISFMKSGAKAGAAPAAKFPAAGATKFPTSTAQKPAGTSLPSFFKRVRLRSKPSSSRKPSPRPAKANSAIFGDFVSRTERAARSRS